VVDSSFNPPTEWDTGPMVISMDLADLEACSVKDPVAEQVA